MKSSKVTTQPVAGVEPDLELSADDMVAVHNWLEMAIADVRRQVTQMKPSPVYTRKTRQQMDIEVIGMKFLHNWLVASQAQIADALQKAGVLDQVELTAPDPRPAEDGRLN